MRPEDPPPAPPPAPLPPPLPPRGAPTGHGLTPGPGWTPGHPGPLPASPPPSGARSGSPPAAAPSIQPARRIGHYAIVAEIGRGGMGVVYRAYDTALRRDVAIKMLLDGAAGGPTRLERFRREAAAAARLRHPGIVAVHEVGEHGPPEGGPPLPFIVMDLVEGRSLEACLGATPMPPRRAAAVARQVALALQHAHEQGVVHRDVKPDNVLIDADGRPHLTDFGLARDVREAQTLTRTGQMIGTPAYMAPEQTTGGGAPDPRVDVYALGGLLYRALGGRPPFVADSTFALLRQVMSSDPVPLRALNDAVHRDLETIALRCLEKEPERRFASAAEVAEELRRFLDGEPIRARPAGRVERARRWVRRNRLLAAAALVVALLGIGLLAAGAVILRSRATQAAAVREARERARDEALAAARQQTNATWSALVAGRELEGQGFGSLLALCLDAVTAASRLAALEPGDLDAREAQFRATLALGEIALQAEQWELAEGAFDRARTLGADEARARAASDRVTRARERVARERRATVEDLIARCERGELADATTYQRAVFTLVRLGDAQTVGLLAAALERVTGAIMAQTLAALDQGDAEEAKGFLLRLEAAASRAVDRGITLDDDEREVLAAALGRLGLQQPGGRSWEAPAARAVRTALGSAQERAAGATMLRLAQLCCEALGWIGIAEGARGPLSSYMALEQDEIRSARAGIALCLLGDVESGRLAFSGRDRFGLNGPYWARVGRFVGETGAADPSEQEEPTTAADWNVRGLERRRRGDAAGALEAYDRSLELDPSYAAALANRAGVRADLGDVRGALADLTRVTELMPEQPVVWSNLGDVRARAGDPEGAIAAHTRAIELEPALAIAWYRRANVRHVNGDLPGALADATRATEVDPRNAGAWSSRALALRALGRLDEAIADMSRAIECEPDDATLWSNRGMFHRDRGDVDAMIDDISRAIEIDPGLAGGWGNRGIARLLKGDLDGAIADFDRTLQIDPGLHQFIANRAEALRRKGDIDGAIAGFEHYLRLAPPGAQQAQARAAIAEMRRARDGGG